MVRDFWLLALACTCSLAGLAVPVLATDSNAAKHSEPPSIEVLHGVPTTVTIDRVAAMPAGAFGAFSAQKVYPAGPQNAVWLRFSVVKQSPEPQSGLIFQVPKAFVDKVESYHRKSQGGWLMEVAGNQVPQAKWAVRGLHPQFPLPALAQGTNDFYVKVYHWVPVRLDPLLKPIPQAAFEHQNSVLSGGILLGFLLLAVLLGVVLAVVYRKAVYVWYAAYLFFAFGASSAYAGIAHYAFWPASTGWSEKAGIFCLMAALTTQLQLCRAMFGSASLGLWSDRAVLLGIAVSAASTALYLWWPLSDISGRLALMWLCIGCTLTLSIWTACMAVLRKSAVVWLWALAYLPTIAVLALILTEELGMASVSWLPNNAIMFALGFEAVVLLVALHLHVKEGHAKTVRSYTLADMDPLSGFIAPRKFPQTLAKAWADARQKRQDLAVVYVRASFKAAPLRRPGSNYVEAAAQRCVRIIRTVMREADTVARVHANLFAVLMPGVSPGENLAGKLSRMIALGVMTDLDDPLSEPINLRIAASSRSRFSGTAQRLDELLRQKLAVDVNDDARSIVYVTG